MGPYCRNKPRSRYPFARIFYGNAVKDNAQFAPPVASVAASNGMTTTLVPDSVPTPGSPLNVSKDHLILPSSLRIACGLRCRKWCHHVGRVDPLRRRAIPCSAMQKPAPRSLIPRSWLLSRSHQRTLHSSMSYFLANVHLTFPGNLRPLSSISTVHLDPVDQVESDNALLSFEPNCCPCGNSMHVHDSVDEESEFGDDESVSTLGSVDTNIAKTQTAQAKVAKCKSDAVNTAQEVKAELVQCDKMWHVDAYLEAVVGVAAKVDVAKCKKVWVDAYLKAIGDAATAATEVIHVYYSPTPPGLPPRVDDHPGFPSLMSYPSAPLLLTQPVNVALRPPNSFVDYPSPSAPHHFHQQASHSSTSVDFPGPFVQTPQLQPQASHPNVFVGLAGSTVQAFQYQSQADLSFSSLSPENGPNRYSILGIAYDSNYSRDSILDIPYGSDSSRHSIHSYTSGFTAGYVADADIQSEIASSSLSLFPSSGSIAPPDVTSQPVLDRTPNPRESKKKEPWFNVKRPTFRSHVLSSLPPTREPSPVRVSPVYIDTFPSSRGLKVMSRQPSNAHPSLKPDLTTVYELRNGLADKRKWKRTKSRGLWRRRFINMIVSWFGGYQNADPIDEKPNRDKSKSWLGALRNSPKRANTPMPSVVGAELNQGDSSTSKETTTASLSTKKGSKSGFSFWGLFKKKNKDMGKGMSTNSSSPQFPSSGLSAASSLRVPVAARSFQGPTTSLHRSMPTTAAKEEDIPLSAMELSARLSALMPDKSCPPVQQVQRQVNIVFQYYDAGTGITSASATPQQVPSLLANMPATPQRIFNTLPNAMAAPPPAVNETAGRSSMESFYADLDELIAQSEATTGIVATNTETALTTPVLQPVAPPVPDVPALLLEPSPAPSSTEPLDLNPACKPKHDDSNINNNDDEDDAPKGAAQADKAEGKKRLDYWDSDSDEHTAEYWLNAYTSYPTLIHKGRSLVRSLKTYHPRNRNSRLEVPTLPASLLVSDDEDEDQNKNNNKSNDGIDDELYDGGSVFDASSTVCATNMSYAKKAPRDETWRSFAPGMRPLITIHEEPEDEKNEGDDEHSLLASSSDGTDSFYRDQPQEEEKEEEKEEERDLTDAEEAVLDELYWYYGSEIVSGALWTAYEAGHAPTLQELVDELGKMDLDMFWKGQALPEPNHAPGPRRGFGKEEEEDDGAGVGVGGCMSQPPETRNCRDREYHERKGSFGMWGDEGLEKHWTV
ncbi:hypothetical protein BGZ59_009202 [Podila verticillata]|nr:hypothetical protein BGZ59_009202 [Podila verticillata]